MDGSAVGRGARLDRKYGYSHAYVVLYGSCTVGPLLTDDPTTSSWSPTSISVVYGRRSVLSQKALLPMSDHVSWMNPPVCSVTRPAMKMLI